MANPIGMVAQLGGNALRFGWYFGLNQVVERRAASLGATRRPVTVPGQPRGPVPKLMELLADLGQLFLADARAVRAGLYPPTADEVRDLTGDLGRLRRMLTDLPGAVGRRETRDATSVRALAPEADVPDYYAQDFHFQTGGYLTDESARLYDVQVETLFYGSANAMRRAALPAIAAGIRGRDQRRMKLLDVACGTGRFLRQVRLAFPALELQGLDLSQAYLDEAARHMGRLRPADFVRANAEEMPIADESQDIVTSVFLFHELPPEVRRRVAAEMARVLKPGGLLVFIDSLQNGDKPGWDGLLDSFPVRFHEPYYRHYTIDDLDEVFSAVGLAPQATSTAFLSKVMVRRKA